MWKTEEKLINWNLVVKQYGLKMNVDKMVTEIQGV
jgi:hypothetical protein